MPSIKIFEEDLTKGGGRSTNLNVVYVPGFMSTDTGESRKKPGAWPWVEERDEDGKVVKVDGEPKYVPGTSNAPRACEPRLCSTITEFEMYFGTEPATYTDANGKKCVDKSYIYAKELIASGLPVLYESINSVNTEDEEETVEVSPETMQLYLKGDSEQDITSVYDKLWDRGEYQFKYLTSGGYPSFYVDGIQSAIATKMAKLTTSDSKEGESKSRGDCVALIDHIDDADVPLSGNGSIYESVKTQFMSLDGADGCAMFTPWVNMNFTTYDKTLSMPGSFAYLMSLAKSLRTNPSWLAIAGATRGQIPNLDGDTPLNLNKTLTNAIAESYQNRDGISINAITNIKPFGYRIWGNRTLKNNSVEGNLTATSFLNTKTMVCDVKKIVWDACRKYMFEQNNDVLWLNFKSYIEPTLNQMKTGAGLSGYKIIKGTTTEKAKLVATIKLYPLYAVEDFEVTVQMLDDEIAVS